MSQLQPGNRVLVSFAVMLLLSGCLVDHCEAHREHCMVNEDATEDSHGTTESLSGSSDSGSDTEDVSDSCGDGVVQDGEECDDANLSNTDECTNNCTLAVCGDGVVWSEVEDCDDGNSSDLDACTTSCTTSPETPSLELNLSQVKQFEFSWGPVRGAQYCQLFESVDPGEEFVQVGEDIVGESLTLDVPLHLRPNARYGLAACNVQRCSASAVVDVVGSLAKAVGYFKASNTNDRDRFGSSLALSDDGNTLAVGAIDEDGSGTDIGGDQADNASSSAGAVYVFVRSGSGWSQQAYIKASNSDASDQFGASVALSDDGNTLAVGAVGEDSSATNIGGNQADGSASSAGAVYVYARNAGVWSQQAYVKASNTDASDAFGASVALSGDGNTLAVGAELEDGSATNIGGDQTDNSAGSAGAVYVFTRIGVVWSQQAYVKASNTEAGDLFGSAVVLSGDGNTLAVAAVGEDSAVGIGGNQADNSAVAAGAVYVLVRNNGVWSQQAYVKASNADASDNFGTSVALSDNGNTLAVGADSETSNATGIDGDQTVNSHYDAGAVYVYVRSAGVWSQQAYVKASNTDAGDLLGTSVALSGTGDVLSVGAIGEESRAMGVNGDEADDSAERAGAAYVYVRNAGNWSQYAYVKASNTDSLDQFGSHVELSGDGETLVVSAEGECSDATGVGGDQGNAYPEPFFWVVYGAGAVYVY